MIAQARRGDGLVGLSTSGNSDNLKAFVKAKEMGVITIGLADERWRDGKDRVGPLPRGRNR